jgi:tRNA pseudouridine65 synthase
MTEAPGTTLPILFQDEHYVAVHKPPGLLMHRSPISRDETFLLQRLRDQIGQRVYPIHRLDRATSGVVVFGLSPGAARALAAELVTRGVIKEYRALARGWVDETGVIEHEVADEEGNNRPQPAVTRYQRLALAEIAVAVDRYPTSRYSLVAVTPETGRRAQIRKHFKHISHHLIGDTTHGSGKHNRFFRERFGIHRLMLSSHRLGFVHPFTDASIELVARPEAEWNRVADAFGWSLDALAGR